MGCGVSDHKLGLEEGSISLRVGKLDFGNNYVLSLPTEKCA
jgi:hypothetical protein